MPENHSRSGKRVEKFTVNDGPHERYRGHDPWTGEELCHGIPILTSTPSGNIVEKSIRHYRVKCPECMIEAVYNSDSEPVCPECGIICVGRDGLTQERIVRDAKAAGRIEQDGEESSA